MSKHFAMKIRLGLRRSVLRHPMELLISAKDYALAALLPVAGALALKAAEHLLARLAETPAIAKLKANYYLIDAALALAPPDLVTRLGANPVAMIAGEILVPGPDEAFNVGQVSQAIDWAASAFDFNLHEAFVPQDMTPGQKAAAEALVNHLMERFCR